MDFLRKKTRVTANLADANELAQYALLLFSRFFGDLIREEGGAAFIIELVVQLLVDTTATKRNLVDNDFLVGDVGVDVDFGPTCAEYDNVRTRL